MPEGEVAGKQLLGITGWFFATLGCSACLLGPGNIPNPVLEALSPEMEKHVKIPLAWGELGSSLPSAPGQGRRKHTWEKWMCQMENREAGRDFYWQTKEDRNNLCEAEESPAAG